MSNLTPYDEPGERFEPGERPLLIKLDVGFIMRIEAEREVLTGGTGHKLPRTAMIRMLLKEALDARQRARNEQVPAAIPVPRTRDGELGGEDELEAGAAASADAAA